MPVITVKHKGDFKLTKKFLARIRNRDYTSILEEYGRKGVQALSSATPVGTGNGDTISLIWSNSNVNDGVNIAIVVDRGHDNGRGYWIQGRHYIAPAILPVMDELADDVWKEVVGRE